MLLRRKRYHPLPNSKKSSGSVLCRLSICRCRWYFIGKVTIGNSSEYGTERTVLILLTVSSGGGDVRFSEIFAMSVEQIGTFANTSKRRISCLVTYYALETTDNLPALLSA